MAATQLLRFPSAHPVKWRSPPSSLDRQVRNGQLEGRPAVPVDENVLRGGGHAERGQVRQRGGEVVRARSDRRIGPRMVAAPVADQVRHCGDAYPDVPIIREFDCADPHRPSLRGDLVHHSEWGGGVDVRVDGVDAGLEGCEVFEFHDVRGSVARWRLGGDRRVSCLLALGRTCHRHQQEDTCECRSVTRLPMRRSPLDQHARPVSMVLQVRARDVMSSASERISSASYPPAAFRCRTRLLIRHM